jgi:hypothetical protein
MACNDLLTAGIPKDCQPNSGGVTKLYLTDFSNINTVTYDSDDVVTGITFTSTGATFYEFAFNRNTSSFQDNAVVNPQNGSLFYDQTITLVLPRKENAKRAVLALLMQKDLAAIAKDGNGLYWFFGVTKGVYVSELPSESGVATADGSKYTITLKGEK